MAAKVLRSALTAPNWDNKSRFTPVPQKAKMANPTFMTGTGKGRPIFLGLPASNLDNSDFPFWCRGRFNAQHRRGVAATSGKKAPRTTT
jgi:hypothetical protein